MKLEHFDWATRRALLKRRSTISRYGRRPKSVTLFPVPERETPGKVLAEINILFETLEPWQQQYLREVAKGMAASNFNEPNYNLHPDRYCSF